MKKALNCETCQIKLNKLKTSILKPPKEPIMMIAITYQKYL